MNGTIEHTIEGTTHDPFEDAVRHHSIIERFVATSVRTRIERDWRFVRIEVERDASLAFELMFRDGGESLENRFQFWCDANTGVVDGLVRIDFDDRRLRVALDAERGASLGFLSNLFVFELPDDPQARAALETTLSWARGQAAWDVRLAPVPPHALAL